MAGRKRGHTPLIVPRDCAGWRGGGDGGRMALIGALGYSLSMELILRSLIVLIILFVGSAALIGVADIFKYKDFSAAGSRRSPAAAVERVSGGAVPASGPWRRCACAPCRSSRRCEGLPHENKIVPFV
jgi:hypothetical protein